MKTHIILFFTLSLVSLFGGLFGNSPVVRLCSLLVLDLVVCRGAFENEK